MLLILRWAPAAIQLHLRVNPEFFLPLCMSWLFLQENLSPCSGRDFRVSLGWQQSDLDYMTPWIALCCWTDISQIPRRDFSRQWTVWPAVCVQEAWDKLFLASVSPCVSNISLNRHLAFRQLKLEEVKPTLTVFVQWPTESMKETSVKYVTLLRFVSFLLPVTHLWVPGAGWSCSEKWAV